MRLKFSALLIGLLFVMNSFADDKVFVADCFLKIPLKLVETKKSNPKDKVVVCLENLKNKSSDFHSSKIHKTKEGNDGVLRTYTALNHENFSPILEQTLKQYFFDSLTDLYTDCTGEQASNMFNCKFRYIDQD